MLNPDVRSIFTWSKHSRDRLYSVSRSTREITSKRAWYRIFTLIASQAAISRGLHRQRIHMYAYIHTCMHAVCMYVCIHVWYIHVCTYVRMYALYVRTCFVYSDQHFEIRSKWNKRVASFHGKFEAKHTYIHTYVSFSELIFAIIELSISMTNWYEFIAIPYRSSLSGAFNSTGLLYRHSNIQETSCFYIYIYKF